MRVAIAAALLDGPLTGDATDPELARYLEPLRGAAVPLATDQGTDPARWPVAVGWDIALPLDSVAADFDRVMALLAASTDTSNRPEPPLLVVPATARDRGSPALAVASAARALERLSSRSLPMRLSVRNAGVLSASRELWQLVDAFPRHSLGVCLDLQAARAARESLSTAIMRLAGRLSAVRLSVSYLAAAKRFDAPALAVGDELGGVIDALKGIDFAGWLILDSAESTRAENRFHVAAALTRLKEELHRPVTVLAAYKGDRKAPTFARRTAAEAQAMPGVPA